MMSTSGDFLDFNLCISAWISVALEFDLFIILLIDFCIAIIFDVFFPF